MSGNEHTNKSDSGHQPSDVDNVPAENAGATDAAALHEPQLHRLERHEGQKPSPIDRIKARMLEAQIVEVLRTCYDPEIPVDIYELGLIYGIEIAPSGHVDIAMTLTSPACPVAGSLVAEVESKVRQVDGVAGASVQVVWDPPWTPERMSESARLHLNL